MAIINKKCGNEYYDRMHRIGYWITLAAIAIFVAVPLILSIVTGIYPTFSGLLLACGGICAIFIPTGIAEMFAEVPVMGSSYYVSCVTGNIYVPTDFDTKRKALSGAKAAEKGLK